MSIPTNTKRVLILLAASFAIVLIAQMAKFDRQRKERKVEALQAASYLDSLQLTLVNEYMTSSGSFYGLNSFLVAGKSDTFLCTSKGNLSAGISLFKFNENLISWHATPRQVTAPMDTIFCSGILNVGLTKGNTILLELINQPPANFKVLQPNFDGLKSGDNVYIVGCEEGDQYSNQDIFPAKVKFVVEGSLLIRSDEKFKGFWPGGAPIINSKGEAVGVVVGEAEYGSRKYILADPIGRVVGSLTN